MAELQQMAPLMFIYVFSHISGCIEPNLTRDPILESSNVLLLKSACKVLLFSKMAEIAKMAANFVLAINQSIHVQFQYVNAFWKRFDLLYH